MTDQSSSAAAADLVEIGRRLIKWDTDFPVNCWNGYAGLKELDRIIADAKAAVAKAGADCFDELGTPVPGVKEQESAAVHAQLAEVLAMTGLATAEELIDMANVGSSLMSTIDTYVKAPSLIEGWSPADDPAEIVGDLYNRFEESINCHRADLERLKAAEAALAGVDTYDRGRRDVLNAILALNKDAAAGLAALHECEADPHGKLPFDVVYWVTFVAGQLGIAERTEEGADA